MSNRLKTFEKATDFVNDVDRVAAELDQVLAHWHEVGQSHWTGGSLRPHSDRHHDASATQNDAPAAREQAAFAALREARAALSKASHELTMHSMTLPQEETTR